MKKNFLLLTVAALLGSAITVSAFYFLGFTGKSIKIEHVTGTPVHNAMYTINEDGNLVPLDFTGTASKVMGAVVNIKSTQSPPKNTKSYQYQSIPDPFRDFFKDNPYGDFFGPQFRFETPNPQPQIGTGSGVIINAEGYIVTNNHVIENADDIEVTLHDKRTYKAKVIGTDPSTDLALIKIEEKDLPYLSLTNSDDVKVGEWVLAVGNPFNLTSTVTAGIVSAKARNINILRDKAAVESFIQTDAAINPGNSGGALVNLNGQLIGINTAIASNTGSYAGYGFAVPSNIVSKVVEDILKFGVVQRGYLGILIRDVNGTLAKDKDLSVTEGVYVDSLMKNSAAKDAGIKPGDVITEVDKVKVSSVPELQELIARRRPGDKVALTVIRDGKPREIVVTLSNQSGKAELVSKEDADIISTLGAEFETIDAKTAKKLEIPGGVKVTKLMAGKLQKYTDISEGFIITKVNNTEIKTVEDLKKALKGKTGGVMFEGVYENRPGKFYYAFGL